MLRPARGIRSDRGDRRVVLSVAMALTSLTVFSRAALGGYAWTIENYVNSGNVIGAHSSIGLDNGAPIVALYNLETIVSAFALVLKEIPQAIHEMKRYNGDPDYVQEIESRIDQL